MGSPANSSSLITSKWNPWPLSLSACSQPSLLRLMPSPRLRLMPTMATMPMDMVLATTDMPTTDMDMPLMPIPMPTLDTTARGLLMLRLPPLLRLMLMLTTATTATPAPTPMDITDMPTVDTMATPTAMDMATTDKM